VLTCYVHGGSDGFDSICLGHVKPFGHKAAQKRTQNELQTVIKTDLIGFVMRARVKARMKERVTGFVVDTIAV